MEKTILALMVELSPVRVHAAGHYVYRRTWVTDRPRPIDHLLIWVPEGELEVTVGGVTALARAGDLVVLGPGVPHRYRGAGPRWEWFWLHCSGTAPEAWWPRLTAGRGPIVAFGEDASVRDRFADLVRATASAGLALGPDEQPPAHPPASDPDSPERLGRLLVDAQAHGLLAQVLARAVERRREGPEDAAGLGGLTDWILAHLGDDLSVADLAERVGWSPAHLHRRMRQRLGISPMRFVTRLRMERADRLLADTTMSVTEIAHLVGFDDPLHFSRRFRQWTGQPPSARRELSRA